MKDVEPSWLLGYLYPDFIVGGGKVPMVSTILAVCYLLYFLETGV
jgi:hypothetical protein